MTNAETAQPGIGHDPETFAEEQFCARFVIGSYTEALGRTHNERSAFEAAVKTFRSYNPNLSEPAARRAVARVIAWKE